MQRQALWETIGQRLVAVIPSQHTGRHERDGAPSAETAQRAASWWSTVNGPRARGWRSSGSRVGVHPLDDVVQVTKQPEQLRPPL